MEYKTVAEARNLPGLRLVLSKGVPGPWGEAAKSILHVKNIPYIPVAQHIGEENEDLLAWTGVRNAPVVVLDGEKPQDRWIDLLMLAERLAPEPRLLPEDSEQRAMVVGIGNEMCGEWGLGWCRRVLFMSALKPRTDNAATAAEKVRAIYDVTPEQAAAAPGRVAAILRMITAVLKAQQQRGSPYLVGDGLTAADIYWATFSSIVQPFPDSINPMPQTMRARYASSLPEIDAAKDPIQIEHRDRIYHRYLKVPLDF
jgi:glutathione S-transferase